MRITGLVSLKIYPIILTFNTIYCPASEIMLAEMQILTYSLPFQSGFILFDQRCMFESIG